MIDYRFSPIDETLEAYADDKWDGSAINYVIINDIKQKGFYNSEYDRMFYAISDASIFPTLYDAKLIYDDIKVVYDKLCIKPYYPWSKLYSLSCYMKKIVPAIANSKRGIWTIGMSEYPYSLYFRHDDNDTHFKQIVKWELGNNSSTFTIHHLSSISTQEAFNDAKLHGIILDEEDTVIGIDWDKFNETKYLWQMQDLGLL